MTNIYSLRTAFAVLLALFLCTCASAQTTLAFQSFEGTADDTWGYTLDPETYSVGDDYWEVRSNVNDIDPFDGTMLFGGRDIENNNGGRSGDNFIIFDQVDLTGASNVLVSFYYNVHEFDSGDDFAYILTVDGNTEDEVLLIDGASNLSSNGWERVEIMIPDGATSVQLTIAVDQNGGSDWFGVDLFEVASVPCGITTFGPEEVECITETPAAGSDNFRIFIPYTGMDSDVTITVEAGATTPASDVTATTTNVGNDPQTEPDGTIILENSAGEFEEGDEIRVTLSDASGDCSFVLEISTTENQCRNPCDPNINPDNIVFNCDTQTDGMDPGSALVAFTNGPEPGVVVTVDDPTVTISGDDPAVDDDGDILLGNLVEGNSYVLTLSGGGCINGEEVIVPFTFMDGSCVPVDLVINEINADPDSDANQDGILSTSGDEFVELYNTGSTPLDVSDFTVSEPGGGVFYTFPTGTMIPPRTGYVIFAAPTTADFGCPVAASDGGLIGLNNSGDEVTVRNAMGGTVVSVTYSGASNQSLARSPDFTGDFVPHTTITSNPVEISPCQFNTIPGLVLPIELLSFTARADRKQVAINWATENEEDNAHFYVDRSANGAAWTELGMVMAGTATANDYKYMDDAPLAGTNYYRLRQVDLDGTMTEYGPVSADFAGTRFAVYPNPATNVLNFNQSLADGESASLTDVNGKVIRQIPAGSNRVDVDDLAAGVYLIRLNRSAASETIRFIKR
ncbi:lamin tail domain-containing protein [Lewinella sp. 4G2]|uniref:lamin tail domain-containing protein n=1 Tax=Lewinella sp. 4G2 TaxID=1803372 RepID=UPI0007B4D6DF|nr:lamin tail domain-containing protein [Lewinella sp. 4G2]OAV43893.1 hypothetical protein A3850_005030 [Lewinella sp. 4G2]